jgi:hypothetical protein
MVGHVLPHQRLPSRGGSARERGMVRRPKVGARQLASFGRGALAVIFRAAPGPPNTGDKLQGSEVDQASSASSPCCTSRLVMGGWEGGAQSTAWLPR